MGGRPGGGSGPSLRVMSSEGACHRRRPSSSSWPLPPEASLPQLTTPAQPATQPPTLIFLTQSLDYEAAMKQKAKKRKYISHLECHLSSPQPCSASHGSVGVVDGGGGRVVEGGRWWTGVKDRRRWTGSGGGVLVGGSGETEDNNRTGTTSGQGGSARAALPIRTTTNLASTLPQPLPLLPPCRSPAQPATTHNLRLSCNWCSKR